MLYRYIMSKKAWKFLATATALVVLVTYATVTFLEPKEFGYYDPRLSCYECYYEDEDES
jgi:hypothetical protein